MLVQSCVTSCVVFNFLTLWTVYRKKIEVVWTEYVTLNKGNDSVSSLDLKSRSLRRQYDRVGLGTGSLSTGEWWKTNKRINLFASFAQSLKSPSFWCVLCTSQIVGRPFLVELINPRVTCLSEQFFTDLQQEINSSSEDVAVRDLQQVSK